MVIQTEGWLVCFCDKSTFKTVWQS